MITTTAQLRNLAETWERVGSNHASFKDSALVQGLREAADEIERLRLALKGISLQAADSRYDAERMRKEARDALE